MGAFKIGDRVHFSCAHHDDKFGEVVSVLDSEHVSIAVDGEGEILLTHCDHLRHVDPDPITAPRHYTQHPSGVECIDVAENFSFCLGNVVKYVWRAGLKGDAIEDLQKAKWYLEREIANREKGAK